MVQLTIGYRRLIAFAIGKVNEGHSIGLLRCSPAKQIDQTRELHDSLSGDIRNATNPGVHSTLLDNEGEMKEVSESE
jgi:hypothetical protein